MTVSTDGQLCFGVAFEEDHEFPWDAERWDGDLEEWWIEAACGFKPNAPDPYTEGGNGYKEWATEENVSEWHRERIDFKDQNPAPVELINYCSCDCPMHILAVPESVLVASRGHPRDVDIQSISEMDVDLMTQEIKEFCERFEIEMPEKPRWYLSSCWC